MPSVALVFQLRAIDKRRLRRMIGHLSSAHMTQLYEHIKILLQFPF